VPIKSLGPGGRPEGGRAGSLPSSPALVIRTGKTRGVEPGPSPCKLAADSTFAVDERPRDSVGGHRYRPLPSSLPYFAGARTLRMIFSPAAAQVVAQIGRRRLDAHPPAVRDLRWILSPATLTSSTQVARRPRWLGLWASRSHSLDGPAMHGCRARYTLKTRGCSQAGCVRNRLPVHAAESARSCHRRRLE
jgi:hypothetical protein